MRLSRPCYDKPHRCPGWVGGGLRWPRSSRCQSGRIAVRTRHDNPHPRAHPWRFGHCDTCEVVTWPWVIRSFDPTWWRSEWRTLRYRLDNWLYWKGWRD